MGWLAVGQCLASPVAVLSWWCYAKPLLQVAGKNQFGSRAASGNGRLGALTRQTTRRGRIQHVKLPILCRTAHRPSFQEKGFAVASFLGGKDQAPAKCPDGGTVTTRSEARVPLASHTRGDDTAQRRAGLPRRTRVATAAATAAATTAAQTPAVCR